MTERNIQLEAGSSQNCLNSHKVKISEALNIFKNILFSLFGDFHTQWQKLHLHFKIKIQNVNLTDLDILRYFFHRHTDRRLKIFLRRKMEYLKIVTTS